MSRFIGIDPGKGGGIAILNTHADTVRVFKMGDTERDVFEAMRPEVEPGGIFAYIEKVHSSPQMGVTSAFTFGRNYGFLRGCLIALEIPFEEVSPQKWQKAMGCLSKGDKNITKARAQCLFPQIKITHAIADALLLAEHCRRVRTNGVIRPL